MVLYTVRLAATVIAYSFAVLLFRPGTSELQLPAQVQMGQHHPVVRDHPIGNSTDFSENCSWIENLLKTNVMRAVLVIENGTQR